MKRCWRNLLMVPFCAGLAFGQSEAQTAAQSEPQAGRAAYEAFIEALRGMDSFRFECHIDWNIPNSAPIRCDLKYWLKKPNRYRVEGYDHDGELRGLLVCDGAHCWSTWPPGTSLFTSHLDEPVREVDVYLKERAYPGGSISHKVGLIAPIGMPVFNANAFFGGDESVMEYLDSIEDLGLEKVNGESCRKLKVSMMGGQRVRTCWLSEKDRLPRKLLEELLLAHSQSTMETWTAFEINPKIDDALLSWTPPEGFEERRMPATEERILQVGEEARDFSLGDSEGKKLSLSEYQGKIIWLMFWRIG